MADDANDVQAADITPDDFMADEQEPAKAEPSTAKPAKADPKPEVAEDTKEEAKGDDTPATPDVPTKGEEGEPPKADDAKDDEAETPEDKPQGKAEERKAQLNTEIRDLVSQRNALREEVTKANAEVYQPATEDELQAEGLSATDAKVEALRQSIEMRDYNEKVADAQLTLSSESNRVLTDFPIFNPDSESYDKELAEEAAGLLSSNLILDPNTQQIIGSNVSPYKLYQTLAKAAGISTVKGQLKGQQATEQMLANADANSSAAPPKEKVDPLMALWLEED